MKTTHHLRRDVIVALRETRVLREENDRRFNAPLPREHWIAVMHSYARCIAVGWMGFVNNEGHFLCVDCTDNLADITHAVCSGSKFDTEVCHCCDKEVGPYYDGRIHASVVGLDNIGGERR